MTASPEVLKVAPVEKCNMLWDQSSMDVDAPEYLRTSIGPTHSSRLIVVNKQTTLFIYLNCAAIKRSFEVTFYERCYFAARR